MNNKYQTKPLYKLHLIDDKYSYKPINYEGNRFYAYYTPTFIIGTVIIYTTFMVLFILDYSQLPIFCEYSWRY